MMDAPNLIGLLLWDLRAQVESQLRCLTKIHRMCEQLPPSGDPKRAADVRDMQKDMADVLALNASTRGVATEALEGVNALPL